MSQTKTNSYKATFILDLRGNEAGVETVIADIDGVFSAIDCTVNEKNDVGTREFARAADHRFASGHYLEFYFDGPPSAPSLLQEKLRLDRRVNRIFTESV